MKRHVPAGLTARAHGFTLLELMVVIVIIGILVSLAVISLGDNAARRLDEEAARFASVLRLAADEAVLQGREIGLEIDAGRYAFFAYDDQLNTWTPISGDLVFRERRMTDGVRIDLYMDDLEMELATDPDQEDMPSPQVLLLSSGEITPFEVVFGFDDIDREVALRALPNGSVEVISADDR